MRQTIMKCSALIVRQQTMDKFILLRKSTTFRKAENEEGNLLITDTDDCNNEANIPRTRHTNSARQLRHTIIPHIRQTSTPDVMPPLEPPTTSSHTEPATTPDINDVPCKTTKTAPTPFPNDPPSLGDNNNISAKSVTPQHPLQVSITGSHLQAPAPLRSYKTRYQ